MFEESTEQGQSQLCACRRLRAKANVRIDKSEKSVCFARPVLKPLPGFVLMISLLVLSSTSSVRAFRSVSTRAVSKGRSSLELCHAGPLQTAFIRSNFQRRQHQQLNSDLLRRSRSSLFSTTATSATNSSTDTPSDKPSKKATQTRIKSKTNPSSKISSKTQNVEETNGREEATSTALKFNADNWKEHPDLNPTIEFRSWVVPVSGKSIQDVLSSPLTQDYLASRHDILQHMHRRLKVVRDMPADSVVNEETQRCKLILLHPDTPKIQDLPVDIRDLLLNEYNVMPVEGPVQPITFSPDEFTASYILTKVLPESVHPVPTAFETVGHVAHLNLKSHHVPFGPLIGQVLLETLPTIETVIHKTGEVSGPYRTYPIQVLAGRPDTAVELAESGVQVKFDLADVYWCSRLSEERQRLLSAEIGQNTIVADVFCGVGALCLQAAKSLNCTIWANDWNPVAVEALKQNAKQNGVRHYFERIQCGDAYDFMTDLGLKQQQPKHESSIHEKESVNCRLPDHVVMNFPLEAPRFLGALRWWPIVEEANKDFVIPRVHVYTFARADKETKRTAEEVAVDLVASNLMPVIPSPARDSGDFDPSIKRRNELDDEYGCRVAVHTVRDVAPGKVVMCVSFSATPALLRCMQGDFR